VSKRKLNAYAGGLYGLGAFGGHGQRKDPQPSITLENCPSFIKTPLNYHDEAGKLCQVPVGYTNVIEPDPYVVINAGRSSFRVVDLLELCRLIEKISGASLPLKGKKGGARCVK